MALIIDNLLIDELTQYEQVLSCQFIYEILINTRLYIGAMN